MKLPHITVEYLEEDTFAIGKTSAALVLGFGIHWAFVYLVVYGTISGFQTMSDAMHSMYFMASLMFFALTILAYAVFLPAARRLFATPHSRNRNRSIAAACVLVSLILVLLCGIANGPVQSMLAFLSSALSGFGTAVLLMSFGVSFSICDVATITVSTAISLIVSVLICGFVIMVDSFLPIAAIIICICLPFLELGCLRRCSQQLVDNLQFRTNTIPVKTISFGRSIGIPSIILGMAIGLIRSKSMLILNSAELVSDTGITFVLAGILACTVIVMAMLTQRQTELFIFRTMMPVVAIFLGFTISPLAENSAFVIFCTFFTYLILEACMWITFSDISQKYRISAFTVFGFGRGFLALGSLIAYALTVPDSIFNEFITNNQMFAISILALLLIGQSTLPNNQEIRSKLLRGKQCPALMNEAELEKFFDADTLAQKVAIAKAEDSEGTASKDAAGAQVEGGAGAADAAAGAADADAGEDAAGAAGAEDAAGAAGTGAADAGVNDAVAAEGAADAVAAEGAEDAGAGDAAEHHMIAEKHTLNGQNNTSNTEGSEAALEACAAENASSDNSSADVEEPSPQSEAEALDVKAADAEAGKAKDAKPAEGAPAKAKSEDGEERTGWFKRKCLAVADAYLLSRRETEVLFLLAKGHNSAAIQKTLFISAGTANTHMRHVYAKLNVHSQQELISLVESVEE